MTDWKNLKSLKVRERGERYWIIEGTNKEGVVNDLGFSFDEKVDADKQAKNIADALKIEFKKED